MKRLLAITSILIAAQAGFAQTAMDKAEKRLADLLAPGSVMPAVNAPSGMVQWKGSGALERIDAPISSLVAAPVRLTLNPLKDIKPWSAPEGQPLVSYREPVQVPKQPELPTKPLVKLPSLDVHTPLPIPILALPAKDRASLGDPAFDVSLDAVMKPFAPARDRPVPFSALNLPDPFEHFRYGGLRNPPDESAQPPVLPLLRPTK
jgi:hypothetical protein